MESISDGVRARIALEKHGFRFQPPLGQNFLLDDERVARIVALSGVNEADDVLEIGPGAGVLTCALARRARRVTVSRFLYSLGIPGIGTATARLIARACKNSWSAVIHLTREELLRMEGIGEIMADAFLDFFKDPQKRRMVDDLLQVLELDESYEESGSALADKTFVITGSLTHYANREALKAEIEAAGGKVAGSVSAKTSYLINNDLTSTSGKNKKAHELGVPIIDEETIRVWLAGGQPEETA